MLVLILKIAWYTSVESTMPVVGWTLYVHSDNDWTSEAGSTHSAAETNSVLVWRVLHEVSVSMMDTISCQSCPINPVGVLLWLLKETEGSLYFFTACCICWIILEQWTDLEFCKSVVKCYAPLTISVTFTTNSSHGIWLFQCCLCIWKSVLEAKSLFLFIKWVLKFLVSD